jgi:hypothetical protein
LSESELELKLITPVKSKASTTGIIVNENNSITIDTIIKEKENKNGSLPSSRITATTFTSRSRRNRINEMRFQSTVRPVLTPLGQRLITLSERKLYSLEPPVGGRDEATLLKGVLVRESVRSAWRSVERGQQVEVNNWQSTNAMGLDIIGEEEEDEEEMEEAIIEERNERWFEELVQSFGDDDETEEHEWAESEVGSAIDEDEYEYEEFEHYTLPSSPPSSPTQLPSSPTSPSSSLSTLDSSLDDLEESTTSMTLDVGVNVVEVEDEAVYDHELRLVSASPVSRDSIPATPILSASRSPSLSPVLSMSLAGDDLEGDDLVLSSVLDYHVHIDSLDRIPHVEANRPLTPIISASCSPSPSPSFGDAFRDDELDCDDLVLPPALHRCSSTSSLPCDCEDIESDDDCRTPPLSCEDLESSSQSGEDGDQVIDNSDDIFYFGLNKRIRGQGLGLDMGIGLVDI